MAENFIHGLSGAISSLISTAVLHPFESIRTRMQSETSEVYFIVYIKKVLREDGIRGVYSGFESSLFNITLSYSMYFFCFKFLKDVLTKRNSKIALIGDMYASFWASVIVILFNTPLWTINTRLVKDKSKTFLQVFNQILYKEGLGGFFKGCGLSILLTVNPVIQYTFYEYLKKKFRLTTILQYFLIGALAKFIATVLTYPLQTVRTRQQLNEKKNISLTENLIEIYKKLKNSSIKDFLLLYNGFSSKAIQTVLNSAIILSLHEKIVKMLTERLKNSRKVL
jgi:solute carrier family 25 (peroxisomal adenine nucleotide transporter), member 17